jgi:hypothetical protein
MSSIDIPCGAGSSSTQFGSRVTPSSAANPNAAMYRSVCFLVKGSPEVFQCSGGAIPGGRTSLKSRCGEWSDDLVVSSCDGTRRSV